MTTALLWIFLFILGTFSAVGFGYIYHKDKRKLMFAFALAFPSISYLPETQLGGDPTETLQAIHSSIDYADNIVKDLQTLASKKEPLFRKTDINVIIKEILYFIKKPENIEINIESSELPKIETDKDMIKSIFVNLTVNGIQAMRRKKVQ